ncbi:hypothetical protein ES703_65311 [subsurface metagenome]
MAEVFAAPRAEEMTRTVAVVAGAGIAGLTEGAIVKIAPTMGAAAPVLTWGALIGTPVIGTLAALFTKGMLGNVFMGVAAGGIGVLGYSIPELIAPIARRVRSPAQPGGGSSVKLLGAGGAPARAAAQVGAMSLAI